MSSNAKIPSAHFISGEIIEEFLARQSKIHYVRSLSEDRESRMFLPNSTLRLWYNDVPLSYAQHWHNAFEILVPVEGNYWATVCGKTYELSPGDIFLIPSGEPHFLRAPEEGSRFVFLFEFDQILAIKGASYLVSCMSKPLLINRSTCPAIYTRETELFSEICKEYLHDDSLRDITIYSYLLSLLVGYAKNRVASESSIQLTRLPHSSGRNYADRFNGIFDYLDQHFAENLSLESVAEAAGFSKFHFSRTFKQLSGCNFYEYLCLRRIKAAESLLTQQEMSMSQIALQSGFSSVSTFYRIFKQMKGCTPTQYRGMIQLNLDHAQAETHTPPSEV